MDRDAKQATLLLHGWSAIRFSKGVMVGWGMRHAEHGDVREDFNNRNHGPTVAPLVWYRPMSWVATLVGQESPFDEIPDYTFDRLWLWWFVGMPVEKHDGSF